MVRRLYPIERPVRCCGGLQPGESRVRAANARPLHLDTPNRFHTWGWAPLPNRALPAFLRFLTHETDIVYLVEYHTGFPFSVVDQNSFMVGAPNSVRLRSEEHTSELQSRRELV